MKKRLWIFLALALVAALAVPAAYAAVTGNIQGNGNSTQNAGVPANFYDQMFQWHQNWIDQAEKSGQVTPDQAGAWRQHFQYMRDFHSQYGMGPMMGRGMMGSFYGNNNDGGPVMGGYGSNGSTR